MTRRSIFALLVTIDALLVVLHIVSQWLRFNDQRVFGRTFGGAELLNLDAEVSFPTWWQQLALAGAAILALAIGTLERRSGSRDHRYWTAFGVILLVMSIDEGSEIHERLISPMRSVFGITGGPLWFGWLIPAFGLLVLFGVVFVRFWGRLPPTVRLYLALGGVLYLTGAVGFEMLGGAYESGRGVQDFGYSLVVAGEEGFELLGQAVVILSLLTMLQRCTRDDGLLVHITD